MKTIIILLLLITTPSSFAQMDDSSLLQSLTGGMQTTKAKSDKEDEASEDKANPETEEKVEINFEDPSYGYTGGKSFKVAPQSKFSTKPLAYFGYDFFIDAPTTFAQVKNAPVPPDYVLGPNDRIKINTYGSIQTFTDERISRDGDIFIPEIGTHVLKNNELVELIPGFDFKKAFFGIFLSNNPIQKNLKKAMLGG